MSNDIKHDLAKKIEKLICKKMNGPINIKNFLKIKGKKIKNIDKVILHPNRYNYFDLINEEEKIIYEVKYLNPRWHNLNRIHYKYNKINNYFSQHQKDPTIKALVLRFVIR